MLFFGTGDREDPKGQKDQDHLFAFKDRNAGTTKTRGNLLDVTLFYDWNAATQTTRLNELNNSPLNYGWYIILNRQIGTLEKGEKCLSSPVVYAKTAYFTTFSPTVESSDPCFVGEGTARVHALNWSTGQAAFNLDDPTNLGIGAASTTRSDRSKVIGGAIPSGVVITVIGGKVVAYIGVGGGVIQPPTSGTRSIFPMTWKLVF